jgi:hypothetical protein
MSANHRMKIGAPDGVTVFGQVESPCVDFIDRVAEQMLMPRSWVVAQIIKEWVERRSNLDLKPIGGESWDDSFKEILGRSGMTEDSFPNDRRRVSA